MKITIRTLKHEEYQFDCEPSDTILDLKKKIHERLQHEIDWQTLIFSGQVLANDRTVESCKILEKGFMVLMVKKPRVAAAATPAPTPAPTPAVDQKPATPAATSPAATPASPAVQTPAQTPAQAPAETPAQPAARGPGAPSEDVIARVLELGFPREDVLRALEVTWNNPDAAVDLLMGGALPPRGAGGQGPIGGDFDMPEDGSEDGDVNPFDLIKNTPQFQQLRILAQQNPAMLEQVLQQLPQELIQIINENQDEFIRLLQEPVQGGAAPGEGAGQAPAGTPGRVAGGQRAAPPGTVQIRVSPEDEAVINNLVDMTGCTKDQVLRAYALFEKDAEMTANYLLNHGHEEEGAGGFGGAGFGGGFGGFQ